MKISPALTVSAAALTTVVVLAGCQGGAPEATETSSSVPHGYVEGAEEASEPQLRLAVSDAESGDITVLDLMSEDVVQTVPGTPGTTLSAADSRYLYLGDADADTVATVDTGVWTVDHGDHKHFYRAEPKVLGEVTGAKPAHVVSAGTRVAFFFDGDGRATLVDRSAFDDGEIKQLGTIKPGPHHGVAIPFEDHLVSTLPEAAADDLPSTLAAYDEAGKPTTIDASCTDIHGAGETRENLLFACADGIIDVDGNFDATVLPYPNEADGRRAWSLEIGRDLAAAPLEEQGMGLLDAKTKKWTHVETNSEVISAGVASDDSSVVALDDEGTVYSIDPKSGKVIAENDLIEPVDSESSGHGAGPSVVVDKERTYLSDPGGGRVLELDPADGLREARSFDLEGAPSALAVTGR